MQAALELFHAVWLVDFEFGQPDGERPDVRCMVAREYHTGHTLRRWADELVGLDRAPFDTGPDALVVAFYASAEMGCFLALGWPLPARVLDLFAEFRVLTNGRTTPHGNNLLGVLAYFGLDALDGTEKETMRELALRGGEYTEAERQSLLDYCETDVVALAALLPKMLPHLDLPRAVLRGRYMAAAALMEAHGVPLDVVTLDRLRTHWEAIPRRLTAEVDATFGVYRPTGQRAVDPTTPSGAALLRVAREWNLDPDHLAAEVAHLRGRERDADREFLDAVAEARRRTGLTPARIERFEADGRRDYTAYPGLDVTARELAGALPALGLGLGYRSGMVAEATDYAARLWELLRWPARRKRPDAEVLREAAERLARAGDHQPEHGGLTFSAERFAGWLAARGIPWPRLESGELALDRDTFREMAKAHPEVAPLHELRTTLGELRLFKLAVGRDGRNRCLLSAFQSSTGRNQPSNARFIFGPSCWLRGLIRPEPGRALAYVDWSQQEFGIAAALSGDRAMQAAYASGDPYLEFAKQAGAVPAEATKETHKAERDRFKACVLAVQYGMGSWGLAQRIGQPEPYAAELLRLHRRTYATFWKWSDGNVRHAVMHGWLHTVFGWRVHLERGRDVNARSLANFPMQANGAEMLRLACCLLTERGVAVCCPVHDALLVEGPADAIGDVVAATQAGMAEASRIVLDGFELRTEAHVVHYPDRYMDPRGESMWATVLSILADLETEAAEPALT